MSRRLTIPSLILPYLVSMVPGLIITILLIEIAFSFDVEVGVAGQLQTTASIVSAVMALLMGGLSVRYRHKSLLLAGLACLAVASFGCYITPSFSLLLLSYSLTGIGFAMVRPMSQALIGNLFPVEERPKVIGYLYGGMALSYVFGPSVINFLEDWRLTFVLFLFTLTIVSLFLAIVGVPSTSSSTASSHQYLQGFRAVFQNKSAIACIIANVLFGIPVRVLHFYNIPFYRQQFLVDKTVSSLIMSGIALVFVGGGLIGGRFVNRFGRKQLTMMCAVITGVLTFAYINVPSFWLSVVFLIIATLTVSLKNTGYDSLALEQVPAYRGTMMSLSQFSSNIAWAVGNGLGGVILVVFDYGHMGILGITAIIAALILRFFTIDPTQQAKQ